MGLLAHFNKVKAFTPDRVENDLMQILKQEEPLATDMVTDQLFQGKDSKGQDLPPYSSASVLYFNKPEGSWRLFESGDFYRGVFMDVQKSKVLFDSRDNKRDDIFQKLELAGHNSDDVLGLSKQSLTELVNVKIRQKTGEYFRQMLRV